MKLHEKTFSYKGYESKPYNIYVGSSNIKMGTIWLKIDYTWTETWAVDKNYNKLYIINNTDKKITHADYDIDFWGNITMLSTRIANDGYGDSYSVKISVKYTEPKTGITYSKYKTYTLNVNDF